MFYGRSRFYCILIVYAKFFMFTLFLLYLVRNDNNKDDQSIYRVYESTNSYQKQYTKHNWYVHLQLHLENSSAIYSQYLSR